MRRSPAFRRLWIGLSLAGVGQQIAVVTVGLQIYDLTRSTFAVGLVGLAALVPLVVLGLYGGALVDVHDRRRVALLASSVLWVVSLATAAQAWLDVGSAGLLYGLVALQSAAFAINSPARSAILPRLVDAELLPAANALVWTAQTVALTAGPLLAAVLVGTGGFGLAYTVDAVMYVFALWSVFRLPAIPPEVAAGERPRAGFRSVVEGLRFLGTRPNLRMTFLLDLAAMIFAMPRVLFPALGAVVLGGGATTVGVLTAALALGAALAGLFSGPLGGVRRQGLAVVVCILVWGASISLVGLVLLVLPAGDGGLDHRLPVVAVLLVLAGAADSVSAIFRSTILQVATPDALRGRLQGVFIVVVAGGPRLGDLVLGSSADVVGEAVTALAGGLVCIALVLLLTRAQPSFRAYDARDPHA
ncbi:MFS transporter [Kineococcus gynurae]|uniref:MFS transporter n=1 Tax=Kineococcus gynurae TaxID=452979 RepID=A0ABV5LWE8_9ACTN